jgi:diguanylate cyclase (GGDEF)-like protein
VRVLVVDDDAGARAALADYCTMRGHDVTTLADAESAWEAFQAEAFPIVLVDWKLPGMDGLELCHRLRASPRGETTVILMVTGLDQQDRLAEALEAGANDFVRKPLDIELLDVRMSFAEREVAEIIERKRARDELTHLALHDPLTNLPNRAVFYDRLHQSMLISRRNGAPLALLFLDLDGFKEVNDNFGHAAGDVVLRQVGERLTGIVRASDTVARVGGDEFGLILLAADAEGAGTMARKVLKALDEPFRIEGMTIDLGASVGIALFPDHGEDSEVLVQYADTAMYQAKGLSSGFAIFSPNVSEDPRDGLTLIGELRRAITERELTVHYQPRVNVETGRVVGAEALLRWHHRERGYIEPEQFVRAAEKTGLIVDLTAWVLNEAVAQTRDWHKEGLDITVAVKLAPRNFRDPQLPLQVGATLASHGADPAWLEIEIPEAAITDGASQALDALARLNALGVQLTVDHFGAGSSSLAKLKHLPVHKLKIDKVLVSDVAEDQNDSAVVRSMISLGHDLGFKVVAEGTEDASTWELLQNLRCDEAQGYYIARPMPAGELSEWIAESAWSCSRQAC